MAEAHPVLGAALLLLLHYHRPFSFTSDEKLKSNSGERESDVGAVYTESAENVDESEKVKEE